MAKKFLTGIDLQNQRATNVASASAATDAVNLAQMQALVNGLSWHSATRVATTASLTLSAPGVTIDGVTMAVGDRVLCKNQSTASQNGIYVWQGASAPMTLAPDSVQGELSANATMYVAEGTVNADTAWTLTTNNPITVGTTALTFAQIGSGAAYTAGTGVTLASNVIAIDTTVVVRKYASNVGDGTSTTIAVTHNLGTLDVQVQLYLASTGETQECDVLRTSTNAVSLTFATAPATSAYRVVVMG